MHEDDESTDEADELVQPIFDHVAQQQQDSDYDYSYQNYDQGILNKPLAFFTR
jgi:hypothetical protein